jgi:tetratricopeptide (TPR) repeat protein
MISLAMIVRNEAPRLAGCLASAAGAVDEIVVVDTGSTDGTPDIARRHGARVYEWPWGDDFAAARNESVRHAIGEWVLVLDADERLTGQAAPTVRAIAARRDVDGADCRLVSALPPGQPASTITAWYCRLFRRRRGVAFEGRLHEQIAPSIRACGGVIVRSDITIAHAGYATPSADRLARNLRLLRLELADRPDDAFTLLNLGLTLQSSGEWSTAADALGRALASRSRPLARDLRAVAWTKLAEGRLAEQRWADAAREAALALAEEPDLGLARYALARALFEQGWLDEAAALLDRLAGAPADALGMTIHPRLIALARGLVALRQRRWVDAVRALEPAAADDSTGETVFQLGNAYLGLGRLDEAARAYREARAAGFTSPHLERRLALCDRLAATSLASAPA